MYSNNNAMKIKYKPKSLSLISKWFSSSVHTFETRERYSKRLISSIFTNINIKNKTGKWIGWLLEKYKGNKTEVRIWNFKNLSKECRKLNFTCMFKSLNKKIHWN